MKRPGRPSRPTSPVGSAVAVMFGFAFVGLVSSCLITIAIWPGEVKLVAPLFCDEAQPDAFVVADTYHPSPGETVTDFTLYCMGPRGDATDQGFLWPFLAVSVLNGAAITGLGFALSRLGRGRRRRLADRATADGDADAVAGDRDARRPGMPAGPGPGSTPGPFVD